jgi:hypothetical protein
MGKNGVSQPASLPWLLWMKGTMIMKLIALMTLLFPSLTLAQYTRTDLVVGPGGDPDLVNALGPNCTTNVVLLDQ